ncbi:sterile alpha motif domain-containing protein 3-like isoform X2 [Maylandia zebra]|uniref:sterile alpha motif domain-containing protein 3-like isoform X2 n=1 Tax=Maylandia zebra TaxID=106582 RepID=UPI00403D199D
MTLRGLSTEELLKKLMEEGIDVSDDEAQRFRDNDVDGETVDCGLTETMVAYLFDKSFKKQLKFRNFTNRYKEVIITLQPVDPFEGTVEGPVSQANQRLPAVISIPKFPQDVQSRLDLKEPVQKEQKYRNKIIGTLYEMLSQYTMYPTHSDYIQVIKALIVKYPFLRDVHGNGYDTWHSQLKRKFKAERAPLISNEEVNRVKEKFGRTQKHRTTEESSSSCLKRLKPSLDSCFVGEDAASVDAHIKVLNDQHKKLHPDTALVKDRMTKTFAWRRREVAEGMCTVDLLKRYPFLGTSAGLCDEVDLMHPCQDNICRRFSENFTAVLQNVLQMTKDLPLKKVYMEARENALAEDITGIDFKGALLLLPSIFKEKIEDFIILGENTPMSPYPTIRMKDKSWTTALSRQCRCVVTVEGVDVCSCCSLDEAYISAFSTFFVFNMTYPAYFKKTLVFLQNCIVNIGDQGDKPLPVSVTRVLNQLY